jgi:hypothetical protein
MGKLIIFGDSNSATNKQLIHSTDVYKDYLNFLGESFETWSEMLSNTLNMDYVNKSQIGASNYTIFDIFCDNHKLIEKDDIVIVNWSVTNRFRVGYKDTFFLEILPQWISNNEFKKSKMYDNIIEMGLTIDTLETIGINRFDNNTIFHNEINKWSNLMSTLCRQNKSNLLFWGICDHQDYFCVDLNDFINNNICTITKETDGLYSDPHFGKRGHKLFNNKINDIIKERWNIL